MTDSFLAAVQLGGYINGFKLIPIFVVSLVWWWLMAWADKDADVARLPRETINVVNLVAYLLALGLAVAMPMYVAALPVFLVLMAADIGFYLSWRKKTIGLADLSEQMRSGIKNLGRKKKDVEIKADDNAVVFYGKDNRAVPPPQPDMPERVAFDALQDVFQVPMKHNASFIELRPNEGGAVLRYTVDGVRLEGKQFARDSAAAAISFMKALAGLDPEDRRKPQTGKMKVGTVKAKNDIDVYTAGSRDGELMRLNVNFKKQFSYTLDKLGFLREQNDQIEKMVSDKTGITLLAVPEGQGLTNLAYAILKKHDIFLLNLMTVERDPPVELDGIRQNKLAPNAPASEEQQQVDWLISQEPDLIFVDRVDSPHSAQSLAKFAAEKKVLVATRASTTFEALEQWRKLVGDDELALENLRLIVGERLVRTLCGACKVAYTPDPAALKKMNMSPDRVSQLYQARKEPMRDPKGQEVICPFCHGVAYQGRTGVFEFFRVDDDVRQAVKAGGTINQLKALFRKQKQRYLQEAALARVELGDTSVEEVLRVMRGGRSSSSSSKGGAAA